MHAAHGKFNAGQSSKRKKNNKHYFPRVISTTWHSIRHEFWYSIWHFIWHSEWERERERERQRDRQKEAGDHGIPQVEGIINQGVYNVQKEAPAAPPFFEPLFGKHANESVGGVGKWKASDRARFEHPSHPTLFWGIVVSGHSFCLWNFVFDCWAHATLEHRIP